MTSSNSPSNPVGQMSDNRQTYERTMDDYARRHEQQEVLLAIGRVEGKLDGLISSRTRHEGILDKHAEKLGALERWQAKVLGMGAAAGAGMSFLLKLMGVN